MESPTVVLEYLNVTRTHVMEAAHVSINGSPHFVNVQMMNTVDRNATKVSKIKSSLENIREVLNCFLLRN